MFSGRRKVRIETERLTLRLPMHSDYRAWAELREESRVFLTPWEPTWSADHLTRKAFTNRVYWAARAGDGEFTPNSEADQLIWLPVDEALAKLTYPHDRKVLRRFAEQPADTRTLLIVRHGTAGRRSRYKGDDRKRPLDKHGRAQAESLVALLLAFGATDLHAADRVRCHQTMEPLADELSTDIHDEPALTEEAYANHPKRARQRVLDIAAKSGTRVICTQGKVIPDLIAWWSQRDGAKPDKSRNRKGSIWVLSIANGKLIAADHIDSPLAAV